MLNKVITSSATDRFTPKVEIPTQPDDDEDEELLALLSQYSEELAEDGNAPPLHSTVTKVSCPPAPCAQRSEAQRKVQPVRLADVVREWRLPPAVTSYYNAKGVETLYDWQARTLRGAAHEGKNLLFSLPTSSGKSLVAELCLLRSILVDGKKGFYVLPYHSVVQEKVKSLSRLFASMELCLDPYYAGFGQIPVATGPQLIVGTPEKITLAVNDLLQAERVDEVGCFVFDEIHMVGEEGRGAVLENLVSKMLFVGRGRFQVCGISATIGNIGEFGRWMDATVVEETVRLVPLVERVVAEGRVYSRTLAPERVLGGACAAQKCDRKLRDVCSVCMEQLPRGPVIVFCGTRNETVVAARLIAAEIAARGVPVAEEVAERRRRMVEKLEGLNPGIAAVAKALVPLGVFYHHSDLSIDERTVVEKGYRARCLPVLCATTTLAVGVNLPVHTAVIATLKMGPKAIGANLYRQMAGRAGRAGFDTCGESFLVVRPSELPKAKALLASPPERIVSNVDVLVKGRCETNSALQRKVLDAIAGKYAKTFRLVMEMLGQSLTAVGSGGADSTLEADLEGIVKDLLAKGIIEFEEAPPVQPEGDEHGTEQAADERVAVTARCEPHAAVTTKRECAAVAAATAASVSTHLSLPEDLDRPLAATRLGSAIFHSCFTVSEALVLNDMLERAQQGFVLADPLHVCYLLAPIRISPTEKSSIGCGNFSLKTWGEFKPAWRKMSPIQQQIAQTVVGVGQWVECRMDSEYIPPSKRPFIEKLFLAMELLDLVQEKDINAVAAAYSQSRAHIQSLMSVAGLTAGSLAAFCGNLEMTSLEGVMRSFLPRICFGVKDDIVPLVRMLVSSILRLFIFPQIVLFL